jgi:hypothetical protein
MDLTSVSTLLGSIKTATEIAKMFKDSDVSFEKAETKLKLAELISALADAKIEVTEVQQALQDKEAEVRSLHEQLRVKGQMQWENPYYWFINGEKKDGPYCQHCYDKSHELIRLQGNGEGYWECKACKNHYTDSSHKNSFPQVVRRHDPYSDF